MLPNLKIALPIRPANDSAPTITIKSIWIEPDGFSDDKSAAARVTAATAADCAASEFHCSVASELPVVGSGLADELTPDCSGQREATTDRCVFTSAAFARWLVSTLASFAAVAGVGGQMVAFVCCSTRVCGKGSSA